MNVICTGFFILGGIAGIILGIRWISEGARGGGGYTLGKRPRYLKGRDWVIYGVGSILLGIAFIVLMIWLNLSSK